MFAKVNNKADNRKRQNAEPLRHELKYYINGGDAHVLGNLLDKTLWRDENADENREYHIRSLYFDNHFNSALFDKTAGVKSRDKYRIRIYNFSDRLIRLERKSKRGDLICKTSATINRDLCEQLMARDPSGLEKSSHPLLRDMYVQMTINMLKPVVIVDYVREAFVHPAENTRVTIDKQLRTGLFSKDLFDPHLPTLPPIDDDLTILEVKYDRNLISIIPPLLSFARHDRSAISKYTICRRFELM